MGAVVDILDAGGMAQVGGASAGLEAFLLVQGLLVFEDDAEPLGMGQRTRLGVRLQVLEAVGHSVEAEAMKKFEGRMREHRSISCQWK